MTPICREEQISFCFSADTGSAGIGADASALRASAPLIGALGLMKVALTVLLSLLVPIAYGQQSPAMFPAAASAFLAQELPKMELAVAEKDRSYFLAANQRMEGFLNQWGLKSPRPVALEQFPACTDAVTDFLIAGLCRISPPGSICEPSTFFPRVEATIAKCNELAMPNPSINTDAAR